MPASTDDLEKRRDALEQEISTIKEAIVDVQMPVAAGGDRHKLDTLRTVQATRERELHDVEGQLAGKR